MIRKLTILVLVHLYLGSALAAPKKTNKAKPAGSPADSTPASEGESFTPDPNAPPDSTLPPPAIDDPDKGASSVEAAKEAGNGVADATSKLTPDKLQDADARSQFSQAIMQKSIADAAFERDVKSNKWDNSNADKVRKANSLQALMALQALNASLPSNSGSSSGGGSSGGSNQSAAPETSETPTRSISTGGFKTSQPMAVDMTLISALRPSAQPQVEQTKHAEQLVNLDAPAAGTPHEASPVPVRIVGLAPELKEDTETKSVSFNDQADVRGLASVPSTAEPGRGVADAGRVYAPGVGSAAQIDAKNQALLDKLTPEQKARLLKAVAAKKKKKGQKGEATTADLLAALRGSGSDSGMGGFGEEPSLFLSDEGGERGLASVDGHDGVNPEIPPDSVGWATANGKPPEARKARAEAGSGSPLLVLLAALTIAAVGYYVRFVSRVSKSSQESLRRDDAAA